MGITGKFNDGGTSVTGGNLAFDGDVSNTINRQFTPEFVTKAVVEMPARKRFFSSRSNKVAMP